MINSCRDLGVTVSSDLSFSMHVKTIVAKAHQRANAIHRGLDVLLLEMLAF